MSAPSHPAAPADSGRLAYKWKVLISVIFGIFMAILDTTVVNVAFQTLRAEYGASLNDAQWIISVYVLSLGITTPLAGFLADRFGMKRTYLTGLTLFVTGSLLCGFAPNLAFLIVARAIQGLGGGIALPLGSAFLLRTFPPHEQGKALGIFGIALVLAPALGPLLGGYLVDHDLWRWIFFINIPVGVFGVWLGTRWLREIKSDRKPALDVWGLVTEVIGFGSVLYGASIASDRGWGDPSVLLWFGIGAAGLIAFALVELFVAKDPLLDLRLFQKRVFLNASLVGYVSVLALFGAEFLLPVYLQALRGKTAFETGLILLALAVASGFATPTAGRLYDKVGPRPLVATGFTILLVNTWQLSQLKADTPISWIVVLLALRGLALGLTVQTTFVTALSQVPLQKTARGSSLVNATRQVVQSIGVAILATVLASTLSPQVKQLQAQMQEQAPVAGAPRVGLCEVPSAPTASTAGSGATVAALPPQALAQIRQACDESVAGFERAYKVTFFAAIAALALGLMLPGWPGKFAGRRAADQPTRAPAAH